MVLTADYAQFISQWGNFLQIPSLQTVSPFYTLHCFHACCIALQQFYMYYYRVNFLLNECNEDGVDSLWNTAHDQYQHQRTLHLLSFRDICVRLRFCKHYAYVVQIWIDFFAQECCEKIKLKIIS